MGEVMNTLQKDDDLVNEIIDFWFSDEVKPKWFNATPEFDALLRERFEKIWGLARTGMYDHWAQEPQSALALVIILDQFPLNMFRQDARQYSTEAHARTIARQLIDQGGDQQLSSTQKAFLYLPFMHSEDLKDQDYAVELYQKAGLEDNLRYAHHHRDVVKRFGRFPHRNEALGRKSSEQEIEYLKHANW
jgi:uncharacterized protein (DUF924 family)